VRSFFEGFKEFGSNITIIINSILLFIVYILGIGITALIARLFGKKFLKSGGWHKLHLTTKKVDDYFDQF